MPLSLKQAEEIKKCDPTKAIELIQRAVDMYHSHFLPGDSDKSWTISLSERLRDRFLRAVKGLANHYEQAGQFEKTVECYKRGLEVDDLAEEFYQHLMLCYQRLGRRAEALAVYERCRKTLQSALGIEPSPETEAIYRNIKDKKFLLS